MTDETLEIKIYAYSKFALRKGAEHIIAKYATTDDLDFFKHTNATPEIIEQNRKNVRSLRSAISLRAGKKVEITPYFSKLVPFDTEEQILAQPEPVLYVGTFPEPASAFEMVDTTIRDLVIQTHIWQRGDNKKFSAYDSVGLRNHLLVTYVHPLVNARVAGKSRKVHDARIGFMAFSYGSQFLQEAARFCNDIERGRYNSEILNAHLDKIAAIHAQDYELAAKMRDRLKELTRPLDNPAQRI